MMPDIAYPFVLGRMKGRNRAIPESAFGHLVSTTDDARKRIRTVGAACKACIKITGNTQPDVLQADLYRKIDLPTFSNVTGGEPAHTLFFTKCWTYPIQATTHSM